MHGNLHVGACGVQELAMHGSFCMGTCDAGVVVHKSFHLELAMGAGGWRLAVRGNI